MTDPEYLAHCCCQAFLDVKGHWKEDVSSDLRASHENPGIAHRFEDDWSEAARESRRLCQLAEKRPTKLTCVP